MGRGLATLAVGGALYLAGVVAIFIHVSKEHAPAGPRLPPLAAKVCSGPVLGVTSSLAYVKDPGYRDASVRAIKRTLGAQIVRDGLLWDQIEPAKGRRDWSSADATIKQLRGAGIEPLLNVFGSPSWANGVPARTPEHNLYVPTGAAFDSWLRQYADFVAAAARRYRGVVHRWEIWNEANKEAFWRPRPDPAAFLRVYEALRAAIVRVDPKAEVATGGIGDLAVAPRAGVAGLPFLRSVLSTHPTVDAVAIHPYSSAGQSPAAHDRGQDNFDDIERVHRLLVAQGYRIPLWVTEWGWTTNSVGKRRQARYVAQSLRMLTGRYRFVQLATYFSDHDLPPRFFHGLLDADLKPKPAASAFRAATARLASRCRPDQAASGPRP